MLAVSELPDSSASSARAVSELYATAPRSLSDRGLQEFYQHSLIVARARMQRVSDRWEGLSVYDVQAVYKFLETAYVIAKKTYIVPADDVLESRDWLVKAKGNNASVVAKALPNGQPEQVIRDVDDIEAIRFRRLWTEIDGLPCGDIGMQLMEAYREAIRGLPSPERRKAVISSVGISYAEIQKRLNICAAKIAQDSALDVEKRREALRPQLEATNREIERKPPSEVLQALENDQA